MTKIAVFPGSFDPFTIGHTDIIKRALPLFDKIIIAIGTNSQKKYLFSLAQRLAFIQAIFANEPKVVADTYEGLTVNYCQKVKAQFLLRGIRSNNDFEFEKTIAQLNKTLAPTIETLVLITNPQHAHISSTIVREILIHGGNPEAFLNQEVLNLLATAPSQA